MFHRLIAVVLVLSCVVVAGCAAKNPEPVTYPVSGTVNFDGKPLAEGKINFSRISESFTRTFDIKDGKFEGESVEGKVDVKIFAYKEGEVDPMYKDDPNAEKTLENYLPAKYSTNSKLTADVTTADNTFTYDLEK